MGRSAADRGMKELSCLSIGIVLLSPSFRVIGMNEYARRMLGSAVDDFGKSLLHYHPRRTHEKIKGALRELTAPGCDVPVAMIVDVLNKVLMINLCRIEMKGSSAPPYAMTFIDVTEQTGARVNPTSGLMELSKFPVYEKGTCLFLNASSIYYIRSDGNYSEVHTTDKAFHLHLTLKSILTRHAGPSFFRTHRSYVVNLEHIRELRREMDGTTVAVLDNNPSSVIPVSRRRARELKDALMNGERP